MISLMNQIYFFQAIVFYINYDYFLDFFQQFFRFEGNFS